MYVVFHANGDIANKGFSAKIVESMCYVLILLEPFIKKGITS